MKMIKQGVTKALMMPALLVWSNDSERRQEAPAIMRSRLDPPAPKKRTAELSMHGHIRLDDYFWLRERENPEVLAYLQAENAYLKGVMAPLEHLKETLFQEMTDRIPEEEASVPYLVDGYLYYERYETGGEYPVYCRRKGSMEAPEEVIANGNELGGEEDYFSFEPHTSPNHQLVAIAADTVGRRFYNISFKDISTGELLPDVISATTGNLVWASDSKTLFYTRQHPHTLRSYQVYKHVLGTPGSEDELIFEETNETFRCSLCKTKSRRYIIMEVYSTLSNESYLLDNNAPEAGFVLMQPREKNMCYEVDHWGDKFYIRTNLNARNFKLMEAPLSTPGKAYWKEVVPHRSDVLLEDFDIFQNFLVLEERKQGLTHIRTICWQTGRELQLNFSEPAYKASLDYNPDYYSDYLRIEYNSLTTPPSTYAFHMGSGEQTLLKQQQLQGDFSSADYRSERQMVTAPDGVQVPLSIVYHKDTKIDGSAPCLIFGYGSYGNSMEDCFNIARLSLLNRGFVYAIAHIRGGQEMGRHWYEEGRQLKKLNTFTDFIACSEYLIEKGYAAEDKLFAIGDSAGGLLMGAISNMRPDLYKGIISEVPFVDVISTMLDASIPLTTIEYDEWGNPQNKEFHDYMLSYSPYDNLEAKDYPHMFLTTGYHDSQVQYWEPAKYVARLRDIKTDDNLVLLHTDMTAGHEGATGRYEVLKEVAMEWAFLLDLAGKAKQPKQKSISIIQPQPVF